MVEKSLTKKERSLVTRLVINGSIHPNYYNGSGRWSTCGPDYAARLASILMGSGMVEGKHFEMGNDALRGGHEGAYVRLSPLGRRRKFCRGAKEAAGLSLAPRLLGLSGAEVLAKTRLFAFQGHL